MGFKIENEKRKRKQNSFRITSLGLRQEMGTRARTFQSGILLIFPLKMDARGFDRHFRQIKSFKTETSIVNSFQMILTRPGLGLLHLSRSATGELTWDVSEIFKIFGPRLSSFDY